MRCRAAVPTIESMVVDPKARAKLIWNSGDYDPIGRQLEPASVALAESCRIAPGLSVLDVAAGTGNLAIEAARRGAAVVAADFSEVMISKGKARSDAAGVDITWEEADVEALPYGADRFDRVTSVFGAMFAPDQAAAASEMFRVAKPGGLVAVAAWTPEGYSAELIEEMRRFMPPPSEGVTPPDPLT